MNLWIKNTKGAPSASLTLVMIAFGVTMFWMTVSIFQNPFGIKITPFDGTGAMTVLSPLLALYGGRRYTNFLEDKHGVSVTKSNVVQPEQLANDAGEAG